MKSIDPLEVARLRGRRDAAQLQDAAKNPYDNATETNLFSAWAAAAVVVKIRRGEGRDLDDHPAPPPHLCLADPAQVCNCCAGCTRACAVEANGGEEPVEARPQPSAFNRAAWALVRIATTLEMRVGPTDLGARRTPCSTCGTFLATADETGPCPVCGAA